MVLGKNLCIKENDIEKTLFHASTNVFTFTAEKVPWLQKNSGKANLK